MSFKAFFLSLTVTTMLLYSIVGTTTVYADDGTGTEPTATEVAPTGDTQPVVDTGTPDAQPAVDTATPAPTEDVQPTDTVLEQLPENTTVTVLDSAGEALPLASQETADAIQSAYDPIWCPAGKNPGDIGCTSSFSSFDELLTYLQANEGDAAYQQAGTIYIQQGAYLGGESQIDFNNYTFTNLNNYDLTLQGGWDTSWDPTNPATPSPTYTTTTFNAPIIIGSSSNPWVGSLTINNISISGVTSQTGLTVYSENNVTVNNVEVTNSKNGADINSGAPGADGTTTGGDVIILNSKFNNNKGYGVKVVSQKAENASNGFVSLISVEANNNNLFGANIQAGEWVSVSNSFFNGNKSYTYSCKSGKTYNGYGLQIVSTSGMSLNEVSASNNNLFGAQLDGQAVYISGGVFNNNGSDAGNTGKGLSIISDTFVSLSNVSANNNQLFGANIQAGDSVSLSKVFFNGNMSYTSSPCKGKTGTGGYGIQIVTVGNIAITDIQANENYTFGASLSGANVDIASSTSNNNMFDNNGSGSLGNPTGKGLDITSKGNVALSNIEANNNQISGATITATGQVAINNGFFNGNMSYTSSSCKGKTYSGYGLQVIAANTVSLNNVTADKNYLYGAHVEGTGIFISFSSFSNNGTGNQTDNVGKGLEVISSGNQTISLYQVNASNNQQFGANITSDGYVSISESIFSGNVSYTSGSCKSKTYSGYGLKVVTTNSIYIYKVTANDNGTFGASLDGVDVYVTDSTFNNNKTSNGLTINAATVTLNNVTALNNGGNGAKICATISADVDASNFQNNGQYGLNVGSPVFNEGVNTYINNTSGGVFYNPSCVTSSTGGGSTSHHGWNWNHHKPKTGFGHGHGASYHGGSCNKSQHAYAKKW
jgi:hypothetical protein